MKCEIIRNKLLLEEWQVRFASIKRSNILQSYEYAIASAKTNRQSARWGLIVIDGQEAGLVQILESSLLWGALHGVILDRGPLWFDSFGSAVHISEFFKEFHNQFPRRFGRKRRILPEINDGNAVRGILQQTGLRRIEDQTGYQSLWWDLNIDDETARGALKRNWRNKVNKAELTDLVIEWDDECKFYPWLRQHYVLDKAARGYNGVSPKLLDNLATVSTSKPITLVGKVSLNGEDIAGILILLHGQSATYQIGWSSDAGRNVNAHNLLLWQARQELQKRGIKDFDLGGINDEDSASGLTKFKIGTGAGPYKLVGQYE